MIAYKYRYKKPLSIGWTCVVFTIPVLTLFFVCTNEYHSFVYASFAAIEQYGRLVAVSTRGFWYYVVIIFYYAVLGFGMVAFFIEWKKSKYKFKTPSFWMFLGPVIPAGMIPVYLLGKAPLALDLTPFGLIFSATSLYIALFHYDFLELKETIRDIAFLEINEGILVIDNNNRLIDYNKAANRAFKWLDRELIGEDITFEEDGNLIVNQLNDIFEIAAAKNNKQIYLEFRRTELRDKNKKLGYVYFIQDVTRKKESLAALRHMATCDMLTNMYNRRKLMEVIKVELARAKRDKCCISALMIDIDHFKTINDKYGHQTGDEVLKQVASIFVEIMQEWGVIGRYGGEEFLAVMPNVDKEKALVIAENIRKEIEWLPIYVEDKVVNVTISIGLETVCRLSPEYKVDQLINRADKALYKAKAKGRNQIVTN